MNACRKLLGSLLAALALSSCAGTGKDKPHVYPDSGSPVNPKPWNAPSNTFDNGAPGSMPQSR